MTDHELKKKLMGEMFSDTCDLPVMTYLSEEAFDSIFDRLIRKGWRKSEPQG